MMQISAEDANLEEWQFTPADVAVNPVQNSTSVNDSLQHLPVAVTVTALIWLGTVIALATLGNTAMCWCVLGHRRMRSVTNYFILNLSIADLLNAIANVPFVGYYTVEKSWPFGIAYCKIQLLIGNSVVSAIAFTFVAIAIERYLAIVYPFRKHMSKRRTILVMLLIWCMATAMSLPAAILGETADNEFGETVACGTVWSDEISKHNLADLMYNCTMIAIQYVVPLAVLCCAYARVGRVLWDNAFGVAALSLVASTRHNKASIRAKRKVVRMLMTVVAVFGTCWLPMHAYFALTLIRPDYRHNVVYLTCFQIAMSNSACNPLIYYCFNRRFRCCVLYMLHWLPGLRARQIEQQYLDLFWPKDDFAARKSSASRGSALNPTMQRLAVGNMLPLHASVDCVGNEVIALNYSNMMLKRRRESNSDSYATDEFVALTYQTSCCMRTHLSMPLGFGTDAARNLTGRHQRPLLPVTVRVPSANFEEEEIEIEAEPASSY